MQKSRRACAPRSLQGAAEKLRRAADIGHQFAELCGCKALCAVAFRMGRVLSLIHILAYLQTIVFILIIAVLVQLVEMVLKKVIPPLYKALGVYLPLITTNCAVLGVTISVIEDGYNFAESMVCAVGAGFGFMLAMVLFAGVRRRLADAKPPKCFEGLPITLVSAAIVSLSFMGFGGVIEHIFGA